MGSLEHVDDNGVTEAIKDAGLPVLVDFFAEWCPPCRRLGPTLESLADDLEGRLKIIKHNVDGSGIAQQYGVMNIPTMILFKDGEEVSRLIGNQSKPALLRALEPYLD
ncbi:MAG: thioredoxin family protein [Anaerolineae bacterium]